MSDVQFLALVHRGLIPCLTEVCGLPLDGAIFAIEDVQTYALERARKNDGRAVRHAKLRR